MGEKHIDIVLIMETNKKIVFKGNWITDKERNTAIQIRYKNHKVEKEHEGDGNSYVVLESEIMFCACYISRKIVNSGCLKCIGLTLQLQLETEV